ncbi:DUF4435 domain-containing protein [Paenibacillus sp. 1781tsa1]|uniref:DUF4435 domain-containing protein n=1 Tax=Paenibacillus sp. 1781tsa1 TaxID=2953810 RepID=UPI00209F6EB6|nr:DUF4435 domain-containing protein [Paenibacillus sp. 1781tsa1]MCP1182095.1 DUF4435 domain-containing protein [Paenibacillus sp. 1781tsa1]
MSKIEMTVDEMIAYLNHSNIPTLLVEGKDDHQIYRWIEEKLAELDLDILPCGGRNALLALYDEKHKIKKKDILFFADLDLWLFSGVPIKYKDIIFTKGYSIENDIYTSTKETLESLISQDKIADYHKGVSELSKWYSFEVNEYLNSRPYFLNISPKGVLDNQTYDLSENYIRKKNYTMKNLGLYKDIESNYSVKIRGKNLFDLWEWFVEEKSLKRETIFEIIFKLIDQNGFVIDSIERMKAVSIE